jgi:pimeloyl-ACP methyl ester carboxylesterase
VPGAWLGGWVWKKVTPLLEKRGHEVYPVTLTGMGDRVHLASESVGVETGIQDVLNVIKFNDLGDVVLAGHSFAGKVVAAAADRAPERVRSLVYVDAVRPQKIGTPTGAFADEWPLEGWKVPFPMDVFDTAGKDIRGADREWMISKVTPLPVKYFRDPITLSEKFLSVKKAFALCTEGGDPVDEIVAGKWGKLDGPYRIIDSGHWPMITRPVELADFLAEMARI